MKKRPVLYLLLAAAAFLAWACNVSEPRKPDTLTLQLNDSLRALNLKYDSLYLYIAVGGDTTLLFHGPYNNPLQLKDMPIGNPPGGNFVIVLRGYRDGVSVLELRLPFNQGSPGQPMGIQFTPLDTPVVAITWPATGYVTNQDSVEIRWTVDAGAERLEWKHLAEGDNIIAQGFTDSRGVSDTTFIVVTRRSQVLFVDAAVTDTNGDGNSWVSACKYLQSALAKAADGWEIWVAKGVYKPYQGAADSTYDTSFVMKAVGIFGGFSGGENGRGARNPATNETILSGERGDTSISDNIGPVVIGANSAILDGFVVERGYTAYGLAAGMQNEGVSPQVIGCTFRFNSLNSSSGGGAVYNHNCAPSFQSCVFIGNQTSQMGGGILNLAASPTITACSFFNNHSVGSGGAIADTASSPTISASLFINNTATDGGAIWGGAGFSTILSSFFIGNVASNDGGAIFCTMENTVIKNGVFAANSGNQEGGAIKVLNASLDLWNGVFSRNNSRTGGGIFFRGEPGNANKSTIRNSIFWGNTSAVSAGDQIAMNTKAGDSLELSFSDIAGGAGSIPQSGAGSLVEGAGNIQGDPLFRDTADAAGPDGVYFTADDGLNLSTGSPGIDAGDPDPTALTPSDITGSPRVQGAGVDMGAYEH